MGTSGSRPTNKTGKKVVTQKIENAKKTNVLSLTEHSLDEIPGGVYGLTSLRTLDLSKNKLRTLQLSRLTDLKSLNCDHNLLTAGELRPLSGLAKLQILSLEDNRLASSGGDGDGDFPPLPKSLRQLKLRANALLSVPRAVCDASLRNLEKLDLSKNRLAAVPVEVANLVSLTELNLDNNSIVSLPPQLGLILKLKTLSLANNQIQVSSSSAIPFSDKNPQPIPAAIFSDTLLIDLNLRGNRLTQTRLNDFEGFDAFVERRRGVKNKNIHGGAMTDLSMCGLD